MDDNQIDNKEQQSRIVVGLPKKPHHADRIAIVLLVCVLFLGSVVLLFESRRKTPVNTNSPKTSESISNEQAQVTITKDGFSPSTIKVKPGTTVTWLNSDDALHQVAADPYPKNDSVPGFDSQNPLQPKDSTSFVFEKPGTFTFHDEKNPLIIKGTIIVE